MDRKKSQQRSLLHKLHDKYRLVIMRNDTLEEKLSFRMTRLNVFIFVGTVVIFLVTATIYLVAFTPLREYIPGYADFNTREILRTLMHRTDSLERDLRQKDLYIHNIRNIVEGRDMVSELPDTISNQEAYQIQELRRSKEDSILRAEMEGRVMYEEQIWINPENAALRRPVASFFFPPLSGVVSNYFNPSQGHFGIDIVASDETIISSTLDGTVIFAEWTLETGYTIGIQHPNNLISIYKHNSQLLSEPGSFVQAGEPIAVIGDTGLYSTGTHLHFELWFNGNPVNPLDYILFQ